MHTTFHSVPRFLEIIDCKCCILSGPPCIYSLCTLVHDCARAFNVLSAHCHKCVIIITGVNMQEFLFIGGGGGMVHSLNNTTPVTPPRWIETKRDMCPLGKWVFCCNFMRLKIPLRPWHFFFAFHHRGRPCRRMLPFPHNVIYVEKKNVLGVPPPPPPPQLCDFLFAGKAQFFF